MSFRTLAAPLTAASVLLLAGCGTSVYYVRPPDWSPKAVRDSTIVRLAPALRGAKIFLDPGHGGDDRAGVGPAGDVVEADLNLAVALRLRDDLRAAGASVLLSRETDKTVPLHARAEQANAFGATIFVAIHHNAAESPTTNYTATFYHAEPGAPDYKPSSQDLARYIQRDLAYVMGNPGSLASFDGTISDERLYPGKGFAVLRETNMTAVLVECGFFTSAYEEQRLRLPEFNDIEAWGIFRGIAKYLEAGIPSIAYDSPDAFRGARPKIDLEVSDRGGVRDESIRVFIDGREEGFAFNRKTNRIVVTPGEELAQGYHLLTAQVRNDAGNSSGPFARYFTIGRAPAALTVSVEPAVLPPSVDAFARVRVTALDSAGAVLLDPFAIRFVTSAGLDTTIVTVDGTARIPLAAGTRDQVSFTASNGPVKADGAIATSPGALYTRGFVLGSDGTPVRRAVVALPDGGSTTTDDTGEYILAGHRAAGLEVLIGAPGYFGTRAAFTDAHVQDPVVLSPVARGLLHHRSFVLDVADHARPLAPTRIDVRAAARLRDLLAASGATVVSRLDSSALADADTLLARHPDATVIRFATQRRPRITMRVNGQASSRALGESALRVLPEYTGISADRFVQRLLGRDPYPAHRHLAVLLPDAGSNAYDDRRAPFVAHNAAWAVYAAVLDAAGYRKKGSRNVEVTVVDRGTRAPAPFVAVELDRTLRGMTDEKGVCRFRAVTVTDDDARVLDADKYEVAGVKTEMVN